MGVRPSRLAGAALLVLALAAPAAAGGFWMPYAAADRVRWCTGGCPPDSAGPAAADSAADAAHDREFDPGFEAWAAGDTLGAWAARAAAPDLPAVTLREYARACASRGLLARADSLLASPRLSASVWAWDALRLRADLALGAADTVRAESLLAAARVAAWNDGERAAWTLRRARLAAARGDAEGAAAQARLVLRVWPALGPAGGALALLDSLAIARGDSLPVADERAGAESEALRGARTAAARRLRHLRPRVAEPERWAVALRLAEVLRAARYPLAARAVADSAARLAPAGEPALRVALERARALRDAGATDSALAAFARVGAAAGGSALRATAWWEAAREAEDDSRWREAAAAFARVAALGDRRADEARLRAGLARWAQGEPDSARTWWRRSNAEGARFWLGVSLRASDPAGADTLLRELAFRPGYGFYRAAARETLGVRGWPGGVAESEPLDTLAEVSPWSAGWGLADDEMRELTARLASVRPAPGQWLDAASVAYRLGRTAQGTRWAERAFAAAEGANAAGLAWAIVPWAYPPAFEPEVAALESLGVERALLWALVRQESRFEPRARSVSDALGLTQLKVATAGDAAQWLREPRPTEATLFEPDSSLRLGARYLRRLLDRFDGTVAVALAAYNAGPSTIRRDWRELLARGGEAFYAEYASNADSQDYVRRILGMRQAYRELRPTAAP